MLFETLETLGSKADRLLIFPTSLPTGNSSAVDWSELVLKAKERYKVKAQPIDPLSFDDHTGATLVT